MSQVGFGMRQPYTNPRSLKQITTELTKKGINFDVDEVTSEVVSGKDLTTYVKQKAAAFKQMMKIPEGVKPIEHQAETLDQAAQELIEFQKWLVRSHEKYKLEQASK